MRLSIAAVSALLLASSHPVIAQTSTTTPPQPPAAAAATPPAEISADAVRAHITFLADDLLEGRDTGSRGYDIAANYVASRYLATGLAPAPRNDAWFQPVKFQETTVVDDGSAVLIGEQRFANRQAALVTPGREAETRVTAPAVFVGYGLDSPADGFDDYAGLDVTGKIVVLLAGAPASTPSDVAASLNADKARRASERGAIGVITINTDAAEEARPFSRSVQLGGRPSTTWVASDGTPFSQAPNIRASALIDRPAAEALFDGARTPLARILRDARRANGRPRGFALAQPVSIDVRATRRTIESKNVIGMLPGSDPTVANEYVLLMAHLDHIGISPNAEGDDKINNGAMDNAAGVATMLEAARALAAGPPNRRPILFAAVTAEERGLLGASYLSRNLPIDGRVVSVVNLDMPILLYDFQDVIAFGAEHSTMGPMVAAATSSMGIRTSPDPLPQERLFTRSDHYRFVQQGVPSVFLMTGFAGDGREKFTHFLETNYHSPRDEVTLPFNWQAGAKFAEVNLRIARAVANADQAPRWYADSPFGRQFAPDAPKAERAAGD
ncbi:hypothetical protein GGR88_002053 [Sphingomonas jejuensis]|uniref:Zn-dependent M28 family amino/carboxypeptidase n=1 Tax=Sphingomonas jejuensis TaxID=904715 RepID=A0ABX0XP24_9SPHN|nr:M28 family metallopeptidase [Sphingomonas jejuensis]NJC34539.1 hypothetical protein [Sphingomonas jejuensis]